MVENSPTVQELWVQCMGQEDPLEESMATHSSIPARRIPWTGEPGGLQSTGLQRVGQDWATKHAGVQGPKGEMRAGKVSEGPGGSGAECLAPRMGRPVQEGCDQEGCSAWWYPEGNCTGPELFGRNTEKLPVGLEGYC